MTSHLQIWRNDAVATVTIDRPAARNALNAAAFLEKRPARFERR